MNNGNDVDFSCKVKNLILAFLNAMNNSKLTYCVTRNYQDIGNNLNEDLDILVYPTDFVKIRNVFDAVAKQNSFYVYSRRLHGRNLILTAVSIECDFSAETKPVIVEIHLVAYISLYLTNRQRSIKGLATRIFLNDVKTTTYKLADIDITIPHPSWELLILMSRLEFKAKKKYQERCLDFLVAGESLRNLGIDSNELVDIVNFAYAGQINDRYRNAMKRLLTFIKPRPQISVIFQVCFLLLLNIMSLFKKKGLIISFSGPDGCGKTTIWKLVTDFMVDSLGCKAIKVKSLYPLNNNTPSCIKNLHAKIRNVNMDDPQAFERDRGSGFWWTFRRMLGLISIIVQHLAGYVGARIKTFAGFTVIVETAYLDAFVKGHRPEFKVLQRLTVPFLPPGDLYFLLKAKPENIVARKPELTISEIEEYYRRINHLVEISRSSPCNIVSDQGIKTSVNSALHTILSRLDKM